ncbi:MAG: outer membrane lipoprotein carrier protein LolA [Flavobacteriaceae bacterium]|nr:outer membrane lipoprotein carrier protein LolA [Flavobacteriaceae bacterium]
MKRYIIFTITVFTFLTTFSQNDARAKKILDKVSKTMSSYDNVFIDFEYVLNNKAEDVQQELNGDVILQGEKYMVNLFGSTQIYDGSKTYTIIPENEEVNVSNADIDSENTVTPSKFFSFYKSGYTYTLGELKDMDGKKIQFVNLVPIDTNSEVLSVLVGVDLKYDHIYQIIEIGKNGTDTILTAKQMKTNQNIDSSLFLLDEKKYEDLGYIINK